MNVTAKLRRRNAHIVNVLSLCSGVGGLDLGLHRAGMRTVQFVELDRFARDVLAHHWPDIPQHDDISTFDGAPLHGTVDLVAGGTPCTDLSVAGGRAGLGGEHSRLFWDFIRITRECAAPWSLWENVPGALSSHKGADFASVLWGHTGLRPDVPADGWRTIGVCVGPERGCVWRVLDARWFGVAQRRRRVFVVGCAVADIAGAIEVLLDDNCLRGNPRPSEQAGEAVAALTANGVGTCGADDNQAQAGHLPVVHAPAALTIRGRDGEAHAELGEPDIYNALRAGDGGSSRQNGVITGDLAVRRLLPVECERLMGWPDHWTAQGATGPISDSQRYRMCGNGVVSNVTEWIGCRLLATIATEQVAA